MIKPALFILLTIITSKAFAGNYHIEALIFENTRQDNVYKKDLYTPPAPMSSNTEHWPVEPSLFPESVNKITHSADYLVIKHLSWGQQALPYSRAAVMQLTDTNNLTGWIKVFASQRLFVNLDIDYQGYRLTEKRRLILNDIHYFDHPKFGLLLKVSRLAETKPDNDNSDSQ